jgi:predicted aminopeptidase
MWRVRRVFEAGSVGRWAVRWRALVRRRPWFSLAAGLGTLVLLGLGGCSVLGEGLGYYWQSVNGHFAVMRKAQPIDEWLARTDVPEPLKRKLRVVQEVRQYASKELGLPDNASYTTYADLQRPAVVWNVFAAPELSLKLKTWCFPVAGCVSYKGYYDKAAADTHADTLRAQGFDVQVGAVPAYSTLGWFDDPVLNTFIHYPDAELARLIFHELGHQVLYVKNDSTFNESFATALEEIAVERWLATKPAAMRTDYNQYQERRKTFLALLQTRRKDLELAFAAPDTDAVKREAKTRILAQLQTDYQALRQSWGGFAGYDRFFAQALGNAHLAAVATYTDQVPGFRKVLAQVGNDLPKYFERTKQLSKLSKQERDNHLGASKQD